MLRYGDLPDSFAGLDNSKIVIVSVPYDATSTWMKGAVAGPAAIIEASCNMELYDTETETEVYRHGIYTDHPLSVPDQPDKMVNQVKKSIEEYLDRKKFVITLGGEHSVSIGAARAHYNKYPQMSVLQLDAHADLRQEYNGSAFNHACVMARIQELCPITQVGIRSMDVGEKEFMDQDRVFYQERIIGDEGWINKMLDTLSDQVYLTLDLDVLDPSIMPSTGTPEPGGMDWYTILELIRKVTQCKQLIGFDIVELCPDKHNKAPDFLAAKLIYKILGYCFNK